MASTETALAERKIGKLEISSQDLEKLKEVPKVLDEVYRNILQKGTDYGTVPGSQKPSLWKPGAELLSRWLHMVPDSFIVKATEDIVSTLPYFAYVAECKLYSESGGYLGNGFGSSNSKEPQYAFKWVGEKDIPIDLEKERLKTRTLKDGYKQYSIPVTSNEIFGKQNDIIKKAKKRAFVDAVLTVTGASRIFTQDIEDEEPAVATTPPTIPAAAAQKEVLLTKEELEYELKDYADSIAVEEFSEKFKVKIIKNLSDERFLPLNELMKTRSGTYVSKRDGGPHFIVPKVRA